MKRVIVLLVLISLVFDPVYGGKEGIWTHEGPYGGNISFITIDPGNSNIVYVGAKGNHSTYHVNSSGIFKSTDAGNTWEVATNGLENLYVKGLAVDPEDGQILYAATYDGVYKSTNGAGSWLAASTGLWSGTELNCIAIAPSTPSTLYAGAATGGVWKSTNSAGIWAEANTGLDTNTARKIYSIAINPSNPATLYLATADKVYKSTDSAASWAQVGAGDITSSWVAAIVIDPSAPATLYIAVPPGWNPGEKVYKSTNGGTNWMVCNTGLGANPQRVSLAIDPDNSSILYAGLNSSHGLADSGVWKTTDGGATWVYKTSDKSVFAQTYYEVAVRGATVYAGRYLTGVYKSEDGGATWSWKSKGITGVTVSFATICRDAPKIIYAGRSYCDVGRGAIWKSTDGGLTWNEPRTLGNSLSWYAVVKPTDPNILYEAGYQRYEWSTNSGLSWTLATGGVTVNSYAGCNVHPTKIGWVYGTGATNLHISTNDGVSYANLSTNGLPGGSGDIGRLVTLAINPLDTDIMYTVPRSCAIHKSIDAGATWTDTGQVVGAYPCLFIDPVNTNIMYACQWASSLKKSTDSGASWTNLVPSSSVRCLALHPADPSILYLGQTDGLYKSTDRGENFTRIALEGKEVTAIFIDPNTPATFMKPTTMWVITPVPGGFLRYYLRPPVGTVMSIW